MSYILRTLDYDIVSDTAYFHPSAMERDTKRRCRRSVLDEDAQTLFFEACATGNEAEARRLFTHPGLNAYTDYPRAIGQACTGGHLHIVQWLEDAVAVAGTDTHGLVDYALFLACTDGHLHIAQWSLSRSDNFCGYSNKDAAFSLVCRNGHLHIAQWLVGEFKDLNVHANNDGALRSACGNGHLHIAQWLVGEFKDVDVHAVDDDAFRMACRWGHPHVAKWLAKSFKSVDVHARDNEVFKLKPAQVWLEPLATKAVPAEFTAACEKDRWKRREAWFATVASFARLR